MKDETKAGIRHVGKEFAIAGAFAGAIIGLVFIPAGFAAVAGIAAGVVTAGAITGGWGAVVGLVAGVTGAFAGWKAGEYAGIKGLDSASRALGRKAEFGTANTQKASAIAKERGDEKNYFLSTHYDVTPISSYFRKAASIFRKHPKAAAQNTASAPKLQA